MGLDENDSNISYANQLQFWQDANEKLSFEVAHLKVI